jgi:integrase
MSSNKHYTRGILKAQLLKPKTNQKYTLALHTFLHYCLQHSIDQSLFDDNIREGKALNALDSTLANYFTYLYTHDGKFYQASDCLNAIHFYVPKCRNHLHESRQLLKAWTKHNLNHKIYRRPLTKQLTYVIACSFANGGYVHAAIATLLMFDCYLRIGECCHIRLCDIGLPPVDYIPSGSSSFAHTGMIIGLTNTKTGPNQSVMVRNKLVYQLILLLLHNQALTSTSLLFPFNESAYRKLFHAACSSLSLSDYNFSPHCLRHGGATHDYINNASDINSIIERGRWAIVKSARTYIQSGLYLSIAVQEQVLHSLGNHLILHSDDLFLVWKAQHTCML